MLWACLDNDDDDDYLRFYVVYSIFKRLCEKSVLSRVYVAWSVVPWYIFCIIVPIANDRRILVYIGTSANVQIAISRCFVLDQYAVLQIFCWRAQWSICTCFISFGYLKKKKIHDRKYEDETFIIFKHKKTSLKKKIKRMYE